MKLAFTESLFAGQCSAYFVSIMTLNSPKPSKKHPACFIDIRMEAPWSYLPKVIKLVFEFCVS